MKTKTIAQMLTVSGFAACLWNSQGFAAGGVHCQEVGGTILTNFLAAANCPESAQNLCTDGTATGDLKGAVGARILNINGNVFHVLHHWVTESGDTILFAEADATNYAISSDPNHVLAVYRNGIVINGGTGRFEGATGTIFSLAQRISHWVQSFATAGPCASSPCRADIRLSQSLQGFGFRAGSRLDPARTP